MHQAAGHCYDLGATMGTGSAACHDKRLATLSNSSTAATVNIGYPTVFNESVATTIDDHKTAFFNFRSTSQIDVGDRVTSDNALAPIEELEQATFRVSQASISDQRCSAIQGHGKAAAVNIYATAADGSSTATTSDDCLGVIYRQGSTALSHFSSGSVVKGPLKPQEPT